MEQLYLMAEAITVAFVVGAIFGGIVALHLRSDKSSRTRTAEESDLMPNAIPVRSRENPPRRR